MRLHGYEIICGKNLKMIEIWVIGIEMNLTLCWLCDGWEQKQILIMHGHEWVRSTPLIAFYSASSLKQQSTDRHVAPLRHILLIPSQPVFALSP
jgi:hypothetical protein